MVREGRGDEDGGEVGEKGVCVRRCRLVEVSTCVGRVVDLSGTCPGHVSPTLGTVGALRPVRDRKAAVGAVEAAVLEEGVGHAVGQQEALRFSEFDF